MGFKKGNTPWNKGKRSWNRGLTKENSSSIKLLSESLKGHQNFNKELKGCFKKGQIPWNKGLGKDRYYNHKEYIALRNQMFQEADYKCAICKKRGGRIELHHFLPVSLFPDRIYDRNNVIVICRSCHVFTDTYGLSVVRKRDEFRETLSKTTLSQVREETLEKVQRLVAEAKANSYASNATTSVLPERDDIV